MSTATTAAGDGRLNYYIAVGSNNGWGRAKTERAAVKHMHANGFKPAKQWIVWKTTEASYVNELGHLARPAADPAPVEVSRHGF